MESNETKKKKKKKRYNDNIQSKTETQENVIG